MLAACQLRGHVSQPVAGAGARIAVAASTRGSSVSGARGRGSSLSSRSRRRSRSTGSMLSCQLLFEGLAAPVNVAFHFRERHAQLLGDVLIRQLFEVEEHERDTLVIRKSAKGSLDAFRALHSFHSLALVGTRRDPRDAVLEARARVVALHLAEEPPPRSVA